MICSDSTFDEKIKFITRILGNNGYTLDLIQSVIRTKIFNFNKITLVSAQRYPVYLPWLSNISDRFAKRISSIVQQCYFSANIRVVFSTKPIVGFTRKEMFGIIHMELPSEIT